MRLILVAAVAALLAAVGCSKGTEAPSGPPAGVTASVDVTPTSVSLATLGATQTFSAVVKDGRGTVLGGKTPVWSSSSSAVAIVDPSGVVTAVGNGSATISATVDGKVGQAVVNVAQQVARLRAALLSSGVSGDRKAGEPFGVAVTAEDGGGARVTSFTGAVTLSLAPNPGNATVGGTVSMNAAGGLAQFVGVKIARAGTGYALVATSGTLTSPPTAPFDVIAGPLGKLVFVTQPPPNVEGNLRMVPSVRIEARDSLDNVVANQTVSLRLANAPWPRTQLGGTLTQLAPAGTADFPGLTVDRPGSGYRLEAYVGTIVGQSAPFDVRISFSAVSTGGTNSSGSGFSCGIAPGGTYCWGANFDGQLGSVRADPREPVPFLVNAAYPFVQVTTGRAHACGLTTVGEVWCWGDGQSGQLGNGASTSSTAPVLVSASGPGGGRVYSSIHSGENHTCGIVVRAVYCWGENIYGQVGNGTTSTVQATPTKVSGTGMAPLDFVQVSAGGNITCGVTQVRAAWCWGAGFQGALGDGQQVHRSTPVQVVGSGVAPLTFSSIAAGGSRVCAVTTGLTIERIYCWGSNSGGYLGIGGGQPSSVMVPTAVPVAAGVSFRTVSARANTTCALDTTDTAWCWGRGNDGEIGNGLWDNRNVPTAVTMPAGGFRQISAGGMNICALSLSGSGVYCWGEGGNHALGNGSMVSRATPTRIVQ
ncbi:MAG: Ig-like domain-containing protein [Gemmatimonadaceae bacterium]|nr:Ig-like domain-containing protein [Gemmatimonadaceae bacterium]